MQPLYMSVETKIKMMQKNNVYSTSEHVCTVNSPRSIFEPLETLVLG